MAVPKNLLEVFGAPKKYSQALFTTRARRVANSVLELTAVKPKKVAAPFSSRACGICGPLEDPPGTALMACVRCHQAVFYYR